MVEKRPTILNPMPMDALPKSSNANTKVISWATTPPELKKDLPPPPERQQFTSHKDYEEAVLVWRHYVAPVLARRHPTGRTPSGK
jgi:hypothetical protein